MPAPYYGRWNAADMYERRLDGDWPTAADDFVAGDGIAIMKPTSVAATGKRGLATISELGSVTYWDCVTLSLDGVFSTEYDNYAISFTFLNGNRIFCRLRSVGIDSTATSDYNDQRLQAQVDSVLASRTTVNGFWIIGQGGGICRDGLNMNIYGPYLTQPTVFRSIGTIQTSHPGAVIFDMAGTHELSTSYDGLTLYPEAGAISGMISVYGLEGT